MSEETTGLHETASTHSLVLRLQEILSSCSESIKVGDESSVSELVDFLETISGSALANPEDKDAQNKALEILSYIHMFLLSSSLDQEVLDVLSFVLPKAAAKFAGLSSRCLEIADMIIDRFIAICSPRDMLSILCGALSATDRPINASGYVASILSGLSKVFLSIQRRHFEQVKVAIPVILNVLKIACSELADEDKECVDLICRALDIAHSIRAICEKMEGRVNEKLRALLGLYVLQIMAFLSFNEGDKLSSCLHPVSQLSKIFPYCSVSYVGLITGSDVNLMTNIIVGEVEYDFMSCLSYIKHGASLSVIWGHIYDDVALAAGENMSAVKDELRSNQTNRWQAIGMLKYILASTNMPWELKKHAINLLLCITNGNVARDLQADCSIYLPSLYAVLQAITKVIIYAPNTELRKNAFEALKRVLHDVPTFERLDILKALIANNNSSSMIAILLDLVRGELHMERFQRKSIRKNESLPAKNQGSSITSLWNDGVLELLERVLRPPEGGPPPFPEHGDAVLSALNLYRFILMTESAGQTNFTGVLSKNNLQKAYNEWLLPLRTLVTGIMTENKNDYNQLAMNTVCALNPVELVMYRCIELVEEKLKQST
ncbi:hypothetical protein JCGZ_12787 [Jatropha curcas]|uniref:Aberrant root formation protein 4 n=1 Tax=Jatropha curcas TaxID=180498 RepID=A0A067KHB4_JATCU|nr:aberrant root formation protein 4 [Jatropha curcas]KDP34393.1 hypothetical protein JCGZ_12787 [Jatropha curcas]